MAGGEPEAGAAKSKAKPRRKLMPLAALTLLALGGSGAAAAWYAGLLPSGAVKHGEEPSQALPPVFVEIPDVVANLNSSGRRQVFIKVRARLEMSRPDDADLVRTAMPRLLDLFNTFLRETRPEELRGSAGMQRLREELIARANIALREGSVTDVLFVEMVVQ